MRKPAPFSAQFPYTHPITCKALSSPVIQHNSSHLVLVLEEECVVPPRLDEGLGALVALERTARIPHLIHNERHTSFRESLSLSVSVCVCMSASLFMCMCICVHTCDYAELVVWESVEVS
jgi:hypothetical protein